MTKKIKLKILHVTPSLNILDGGIPMIVKNYCEMLQKKNFLVTIYSKKLLKTQIIKIDSKINKVIDKYKNKFFFLISLKTLNSVIKTKIGSFNFIHIHGLWDPLNFFVARIARKNLIPYAVNTHGMLEKWSLDEKALKKKIAWHLYQKVILLNSSSIIVASRKEFERVKSLGFKRNLNYIPYIVNQNKYISFKKIRDNEINFLFLSRLHKKKGIEDLIDALSEINNFNWNLKIVGSSGLENKNYENKLKLKVDNYKLEKKIKFFGNLNGRKKNEMYKSSDVLILPTYSENFGLVVAEALNFSIPVITTNKTPWVDLHNKGCWIINPGKKPLLNMIDKILKMKKKKLKSMGKKGKIYLSKNYNNLKTINKLTKLYVKSF